ncbi:xylulose kinase [Egibacter rhizosphaerae]|uniref:Xylulose kinase n=1 Tax=Egibacter rhizosphaerae TaxID=1670831 RepID=A0A411YFN6_9ACTN|nr:FGGY family carbohydrate kinase [Egibacter rhizosphaerae]QBI19927.1 xylulose kinase [Egibacter rhizosphaerae]
MALFVGCDLGTTGTKAGVVSDRGEILSEASEEVELLHPRPGEVEQDFADIEASAHRTMRRALAEVDSSEVAGVAFSGQMSGLGFVDADHAPATRYDSWLDQRCAPFIELMNRHARRVVELSGCPPTYSHGPKLLWWQSERPEELARTHCYVVPHTYVAGRLGGLSGDDAYLDLTCTGFSNLSDTVNGAWSDELVGLFDAEKRVLPRIVPPTEVIGHVTAAAAEQTGLPTGVPIAAGAGDQIAAALGAGVVTPGEAYDSAGTASVFAVCTDDWRPDTAHQTLSLFPAVVPGLYIALAFINGGGFALRWFRDELAGDLADGGDPLEQLNAMAAAAGPGAGGLLWFPSFQGGVLPPRPRERSAWIGLTSGHDRGHMFRAILEGIAFEYAEWVDLIRGTGQEVHDARALGGGAKSDLWNQIKADVSGVTWHPTSRQEAAMLGNALVAGAATGYVDDLTGTARAWQGAREAFEPDAQRRAAYVPYRDAYAELREGLAGAFAKLSAAVEQGGG